MSFPGVPANEELRMSRVAHLVETRSVGELVEMLSDPSWQVRRLVVEALSGLAEIAVPGVIDALKTSRDNEARIAAAVDTLVACRANIDRELEILSAHPDVAVVADAIQIMGRRKMESATPKLAAFTAHADDVIAVCAIEALGRIGGRAAIEALIRTIGSGVFFRVFPAIDILGRSGDRRVVSPLAALLVDPTYLPEAARALGRTAERSAVKPLVQLALSPIDSLTRLALLGLGDLIDTYRQKFGAGPSSVEAALFEEGSDALVRRIIRVGPTLDTFEQLAACQIFSALKKPEAAPFLEILLAGPPAVAANAAAALKALDLGAENALLTAIEHGDTARILCLLPAVERARSAPALAFLLRNPAPEVRALTAETLARLGNPAVLPQIFAALEDSHAKVIHAATAAAQTLGTREARLLALGKVKSENPLVRRAALRILGYFGDEAALEPMLNGLADPDARVREVAVQGLPYLEGGRGLAALMEISAGEDDRLRAQAMRAFSAIPDGAGVPERLLLALSDGDPWVRYYACQTLGRISHQAAVPAVAKLLHDSAGQVRVAAVEALSHLKGEAARTAMREAATSGDPDVERAALMGLGLLGSLYDLPTLQEAARSEDPSTQLIALSALNQFSASAVLPTIAAAIGSPAEQIRAAAFGLLQGRPEPEATSILIDALDGPEDSAARAALATPSPGRISGILSALEVSSDDRAHALGTVLAKIPGPTARRALLSAMALENPAARRAAANLLGLLQDAEAREHLADAAANDPDPGVRAISLLGLEE